MRVILSVLTSLLFILTAAAQPSLVVSQPSLEFHGTSGKTVLVASTGTPVSYQAKTGYWSSGTGWLSVSSDSGITPSPLTINVDSSNLGRGVYYGYVQLSSDAGAGAVIDITLNIGRTASSHSKGSVHPETVYANDSTGPDVTMPQGQAHGSPQTQTVKISSSFQQDSYIAEIDFDQSDQTLARWLSATPSSGSLAARPLTTTLTITADPSTLNAGTYVGYVKVTGTHEEYAIITVHFTVSGTSGGSSITASPSTLNPFSYILGGTPPPAQPIQLSSTSPTTFTVSVPSDATWLTVDTLSGSTPKTLNVSIKTSALTSAGTRSTTITITGGSGSPIQIPVQLAVTSNSANAFTASPTSVSLTQTLGATAASQTVHLTNATATSFTVTTPSTATWLTVSATTGTTPADITFTVNTTGLTAGTSSTTVAINKGMANELDIPVTLTASATAGAITASPTTVSFTQIIGGAAPPSQTVQLSASTATAFTTATSANWLTITPSAGTTPATLSLSVNTANLTPGRYTTNVNVQTGSTTAVAIPVTLTITAGTSGSTILVLPSTIAFAHTIGASAYHLQFVHVDATAPTAFSATPTVSWLTISPASGTTPADMVVTADGTSLTAGTYQGQIEIDGGPAPAFVTVQLTVAADPNSITVAPTSVSFTQTVGSTSAAPQTVHLSSSLPVKFNVLSTATWFTVSPLSGTTPADLTITPTAGTLQSGNYQDAFTINGGTTQVTVPVSLNLSASGATISSTPPSVTFSQVIGSPAPAPQTLQLASSLPANFTAATPTPWLKVSPSSGTTPASLTVTANGAGLSAGTYQGTIAVLGGGTPTSIPVSFSVSNPVPIVNAVLTPATLTFNASDVGPAPASQSVAVSSSGAQFGFSVSATTSDGGLWLTVTPITGTSPAKLLVGIVPAGLKGGQYTGTITVTPADPSIAPQTVAVGLNMAIAPAVRTIMNSASLLPGAVSPGELITISGSGLGPTPAVSANMLGTEAVDLAVASTRVLFDGMAAPILFASTNQINAIVPYGVAGMPSTNMQVEVAGIRSNPIDIRVVNTAPGIFTTTSNGMGQAAVINEDGTPNGPASAAPRGSVVSIFGTGEGQTKPPGQDGKIITTDLAIPIAPVVVKIGGAPAEVLYAGSFPGQVAGNLQINVRVPMNITIGAQLPLEVDIDGAASQFGVYIAIK